MRVRQLQNWNFILQDTTLDGFQRPLDFHGHISWFVHKAALIHANPIPTQCPRN